jgi:glycosyltransferase involved in cell wall biosynthesis
MKLSLVIPYYNRKELLQNVLKSINMTGDIEIIIVDDGSNKENKVDFDFIEYKVIRLEKPSTWRGPCIAYNAGFKAATGDVIMLNGSECIHAGDITGYVFKNMKEKTYLAFSTYMAKEKDSFKDIDWNNNTEQQIRERIKPQSSFWGVHSSIGNSIPYCGVINREDLDILGGYDERFAGGIGYDDYDFTERIYNLGLKMPIIDEPFVIHQWHKPVEYSNDINIDLLNYLHIHFPNRIKANVES